MAEINIEVDEFISCCSSWEKRELADALKESGYLYEEDKEPYPLDTNGRGYDAYEFEEKLTIKQKIILEYLAEEIFLLEKEYRIRKYLSNNYDKEVLDLILKYIN